MLGLFKAVTREEDVFLDLFSAHAAAPGSARRGPLAGTGEAFTPLFTRRGIPASTTGMIASAIVGVGASRRVSAAPFRHLGFWMT